MADVGIGPLFVFLLFRRRHISLCFLVFFIQNFLEFFYRQFIFMSHYELLCHPRSPSIPDSSSYQNFIHNFRGLSSSFLSVPFSPDSLVPLFPLWSCPYSSPPPLFSSFLSFLKKEPHPKHQKRCSQHAPHSSSSYCAVSPKSPHATSPRPIGA
ncbi:hypothetical protein TNCV_3082141 [Trichonephila clavipes]|nr:hypothetical protein TNCV_3082141 [Trichonephila clavipes]